ncbi:hypothetical protein [Pseudomonas koreensis]|uniref:hypothetical protein n=1 Tax=Pseudomonas koreensis TaxID=198620 RepID=UPI003D98636F
MNKSLTTLTLASLLLSGSLFTQTSSAATPAASSGTNQAQSSESNEEKANKKGEEASGSNSGAEPQEAQKDAATSSDSEDIQPDSKQ